MTYFWYYYNTALRHIFQLNMQQWFLVLIGVVLIGLFCMRGFGSRSTY